jgi:hypothetical protein
MHKEECTMKNAQRRMHKEECTKKNAQRRMHKEGINLKARITELEKNFKKPW